MSQLGESVVAYLSTDIDHDENLCFFCQAAPQPAADNDFTADFDWDVKSYDGPLDNNSGKLGKALGDKPALAQLSFAGKKGTLPCSAAAHHLVPGNASLKASKFHKQSKYLHVDGTAEGNIGFDINNRVNGIWAPGPYAMYTPKSASNPEPVKGWKASMSLQDAQGQPTGDSVTQQEYAEAALGAFRVQFHDSHVSYSKKMAQALDAVYDKLELSEAIVCEHADEKHPPGFTMQTLLARLNNISQRATRFISFPVDKWKADMYLSNTMKCFIAKKVRVHSTKKG